MADLPAQVRRDLERAADGAGRVPTTAHPDCRCAERRDVEGGGYFTVVTRASRAACPQHGDPD